MGAVVSCDALSALCTRVQLVHHLDVDKLRPLRVYKWGSEMFIFSYLILIETREGFNYGSNLLIKYL